MSSVPESRRGEAATEYVFTAQKLYHLTLDCAFRLPKRWTFFISESLVRHAEAVLHHAKSANSIYVTCAADAQLRRMHLQEAYCHAQTLSSLVDETYLRKPVRTKGSEGGEHLKPCIADGTFADWVRMLDKEFGLLKGVMKSDSKRYGDMLGEELAIPEGGLQLSFART